MEKVFQWRQQDYSRKAHTILFLYLYLLTLTLTFFHEIFILDVHIRVVNLNNERHASHKTNWSQISSKEHGPVIINPTAEKGEKFSQRKLPHVFKKLLKPIE